MSGLDDWRSGDGPISQSMMTTGIDEQDPWLTCTPSSKSLPRASRKRREQGAPFLSVGSTAALLPEALSICL